LHQRAFDLLEIEPTEKKTDEKKQAQIVDKLCVLNNVNQKDAIAIVEGAEFTMSRTGRIRNVTTAEGNHLFSPRLAEGGISFTIDGAKWAHSIRREKIPTGFYQSSITQHIGKGLAYVVVDDDASPFIQQGRNVMHGFILACDPWMRPNETVLIVDKTGRLLAVGRSQATIAEMATFRKGIAVKIREGCP
jgi:predicted RNA-binding protein (TIGR00451 family)